MIINHPKRFIFIASPKAGSTTVEMFLKRHASVALLALGKHLSCDDIKNNLSFLFELSGVPFENYFKFGVARDPISRLVSWYNYRQREGVSPERSLSKISFRDFASMEMLRDAKSHDQHTFFSCSGKIAVDYLIPIEYLNDSMVEFCRIFNINRVYNPELHIRNVSIKRFTVADIEPDLIEMMRKHYANDIRLHEMARQGAFGSMENAAKNKLILIQ